RLQLAPAEVGTSLECLWGVVEAQRINEVQMPPSLLQALLPFAGDDQLDSLRLVLIRCLCLYGPHQVQNGPRM
ncbi:hypothetical protein, partial [Pseudomonas aeruginosa]|uniref:hypothetical protein n=1 Tax=Pseudomonas aeruginosa TaxID=287 RepID=UPI003CC69862